MAAAALVILVTGAALAAGDGIHGRWTMVEQTYGSGAQNLAPRSEGLHLDVGAGIRDGQVATWIDSAPADVREWPAVFFRGGPVAVELHERVVDQVSGTMTARYRVDSAEPGGLVLEVEESYALDDGGAALVGRVVIEMFRDGEPRGGYELQRRFERVP